MLGGKLPDDELCRRFDASRFTIRAALMELSGKGMIARRPGNRHGGDRRHAAPALSEGYASIEDMLKVASVRRSTSSIPRDGAGPGSSDRLRVRYGRPFFRIEGLRSTPADRATALGWVEVHLDPLFRGMPRRLSDLPRS